MGLELILIAALAVGVGAAFTGDSGFIPAEPGSDPDTDDQDGKTEPDANSVQDSFDHTNDLVNADDGPAAWDTVVPGEVQVQNPPATLFSVDIDDPEQNRSPVVPLGRTVLSLYPTEDALEDFGAASDAELADFANDLMGSTRGAHEAPLVRFAIDTVPDDALNGAEIALRDTVVSDLPEGDQAGASTDIAELMLRKLRDMAATDDGRSDLTSALGDLEGENAAAVRVQTMQAAMEVTDPDDWPADLQQAIADRLALQRDADTYNLYFREAGTHLTVRDIPNIFQNADGQFGPDVTDVNNDGHVNALDAAQQTLKGNLDDLGRALDIDKVTLGPEQDAAVLRPDEAHTSFDKWRDNLTPTPLVSLGDGDDRLTFGTGVAVEPGEGTDFLTLRVEADTYEGGVGTQRSGSDYYIGANVDFSDPNDTIVIDFETAGDQYIHLVQVSDTVSLEYGQATQVRLDVWVSDQRTLPAGTFESIYLGPANDGVVPVVQKLVGLNLGYSSVAAVDPYADSPLEGVNEGAIRQWQIGRDIFIDREVVSGSSGSNVINITV